MRENLCEIGCRNIRSLWQEFVISNIFGFADKLCERINFKFSESLRRKRFVKLPTSTAVAIAIQYLFVVGNNFVELFLYFESSENFRCARYFHFKLLTKKCLQLTSLNKVFIDKIPRSCNFTNCDFDFLHLSEKFVLEMVDLVYFFEWRRFVSGIIFNISRGFLQSRAGGSLQKSGEFKIIRVPTKFLWRRFVAEIFSPIDK